MMLRWCLAGLIAVVLTGCAGITHRQVGERLEKDFKGIRYYRTSLYLLVYSDGKNGLKWELHRLPDPTKKMDAKPYNYLATLQAKLTFDEKGGLSQTAETVDSASLTKAALAAVTGLAPQLALLNVAEDKGPYVLPPPHLYKLVYNEDLRKYDWVGGPATGGDIKITLQPKEKEEEEEKKENTTPPTGGSNGGNNS